MRRLFTFLFLFVGVTAFGQKATNVKYTRDGNFYIVFYHLDSNANDVNLLVSFDSGKTYSKPLKELFGDFGKVMAGNRTIYWDAQSEMDSVVIKSPCFKVITEATPYKNPPVFNIQPTVNNLSSEDQTGNSSFSSDFVVEEGKWVESSSNLSKKAGGGKFTCCVFCGKVGRCTYINSNSFSFYSSIGDFSNSSNIAIVAYDENKKFVKEFRIRYSLSIIMRDFISISESEEEIITYLTSQKGYIKITGTLKNQNKFEMVVPTRLTSHQ